VTAKSVSWKCYRPMLLNGAAAQDCVEDDFAMFVRYCFEDRSTPTVSQRVPSMMSSVVVAAILPSPLDVASAATLFSSSFF
jgi:hypothetical protein